ncbi:MAG: GNAT family N-acetyltransferase [Cellulomonadaceae bacterium]|nr:GNAT family N-acetyltransferase [Cellulomonadaceae bacterium]
MNSERFTARPATQEESTEISWLAALTFPLACPASTDRMAAVEHVATHLTPGHFARFANDPEFALLVVESADGELTVPGTRLLGYSLVHYGSFIHDDEARALADATHVEGPYVEVSKIYAHPHAVGTGAAAVLMDATINAAHQLSLTQGDEEPRPVWIGTNIENVRAQSFYRRHGFTVIGRRVFDVGGEAHKDIMMLLRR